MKGLTTKCPEEYTRIMKENNEEYTRIMKEYTRIMKSILE